VEPASSSTSVGRRFPRRVCSTRPPASRPKTINNWRPPLPLLRERRTRGPRLDRLLQRWKTPRSTRRRGALRARGDALPIDYQGKQHPNGGRHL